MIKFGLFDGVMNIRLRMGKIVASFIAMALCWALVGCGQSGPLFLPDAPPAPASSHDAAGS
jgi:predicted small lipoprotein YifL